MFSIHVSTHRKISGSCRQFWSETRFSRGLVVDFVAGGDGGEAVEGWLHSER